MGEQMDFMGELPLKLGDVYVLDRGVLGRREGSCGPAGVTEHLELWLHRYEGVRDVGHSGIPTSYRQAPVA